VQIRNFLSGRWQVNAKLLSKERCGTRHGVKTTALVNEPSPEVVSDSLSQFVQAVMSAVGRSQRGVFSSPLARNFLSIRRGG
jgi:hypothetical protein